MDLIEDPRRSALLVLVEPNERSATCNRFLEPLRLHRVTEAGVLSQAELLLANVAAANARRGNGTADLIRQHPAEALAFAAWTIEWNALPWQERKKQRASGRGSRSIAERSET